MVLDRRLDHDMTPREPSKVLAESLYAFFYDRPHRVRQLEVA